jgi:hypothetical protein
MKEGEGNKKRLAFKSQSVHWCLSLLSIRLAMMQNHVIMAQLDFPPLPSNLNFGRPRSSHLPSATPIDHLIMLSSRAAPQRIAVPRAIARTQTRPYATPAAADSKPPKALYGLDGTYATALVRYLRIKCCQLR